MTATINLNLIKQARIKKGLTLSQMAKRMGLSGAEKYYRRESGAYKFQASEIPILAKTLEIPIEKIFVLKLPKSQVET